MISLRLLTRNVTPQLAGSTQRLHTSKILFDANSSDSDSSDNEKRKKKIVEPEKDEKKEKSVHRLNSLLQAMTKESKVQSRVNIAVKPKKTIQAKIETPTKTHGVPEKLFADKLTGAAKDVATALGGDVKKTESELLKKILTPSTSAQEPIDLSKLVIGMKIDRTKPENVDTSSNRADQVRAAMQRTNQYAPYQQQMDQLKKKERHQAQHIPMAARVDIDSGIPMGLFNVESEAVLDPNTPTLSTWDLLERRELKLLVTHPPINFIEQMIRWTEQGRLWRFPIDNEQDMNIGQEEHFSEHIFLEQHLEGWCPTKGPIRHFMELVCVGLSKNPYMFAKDKRERIMWFKTYFENKRELLEELGVYGTVASNPDKKQIEV